MVRISRLRLTVVAKHVRKARESKTLINDEKASVWDLQKVKNLNEQWEPKHFIANV